MVSAAAAAAALTRTQLRRAQRKHHVACLSALVCLPPPPAPPPIAAGRTCEELEAMLHTIVAITDFADAPACASAAASQQTALMGGVCRAPAAAAVSGVTCFGCGLWSPCERYLPVQSSSLVHRATQTYAKDSECAFSALPPIVTTDFLFCLTSVFLSLSPYTSCF